VKYLMILWMFSTVAIAGADTDIAHKYFGMTNSAGYIKGVVGEVIQTERYTYLKMSTLTKSVWVASYKFNAEQGDLVRFKPSEPLKNFKSPTLKRTFSSIYFVDELELGRQPKAK
jgi:hypothetical protein